MSNIIDNKLLKQIFGHTLIKLADKLLNTTNKEENQILLQILTQIKINFMKWILLIIG